ncbi:MAG: SAM-dependent methyltransferase [Lachnospiraceae bacterium]|nr:SAM-dependent methyltransferase [Lachnospiraceae bacterium]MBQ8300324.1 SAM-dependent methyltransferase [Clostridia bacterium]
MNEEYLKKIWKQEEELAHINGWDFSHLHGRYEAENDLPWDYEKVVRGYLASDMQMMDYDTGGGEFLLSLEHPFEKTSATEGYAPNVELCREKLLPLGIHFKECNNPYNIPFEADSFDIMINRHGGFAPTEIYRLLRKSGVFITEQVGGDNERDLVEMVLPGTEKPFPELNLKTQRKKFEEAGFKILRAEETYRPIYFYDVGAFVWFAHIIEWEFPDFSVDKCFKQLLKMQEKIEKNGFVQGTIHRYLIVATK